MRFYNQPQGTRVRGTPKNQLVDYAMSDIKKYKIRNCKEQSRDRGIWRSIMEARYGCSAHEEEEKEAYKKEAFIKT